MIVTNSIKNQVKRISIAMSMIAMYLVLFTSSAFSQCPGAEVVIIEEPKPIIACAGSINNSLEVVVAFDPLYNNQVYFQWFKRTPDGVMAYDPQPVQGEGRRFFNNVTFDQAGVYYCNVWIDCNVPGMVQTKDVVVNVLSTVQITRHAEDMYVGLGQTATASVGAHAVGQFDAEEGVYDNFGITYQWSKNGQNLVDNAKIAGANSSILSITNLNANDYGPYVCTMSTQCGSATSSFTLQDLPNAIISMHPADVTICSGESASMTVEATASAPGAMLSYQWKMANGNAIPEGNGITGTMTNTIMIAAGTPIISTPGIYCEITVMPGGRVVMSNPANLVVNDAPVITQEPTDVTAETDKAFQLEVVATGGVTFQWSKDGTDLMTNGGDTPIYAVAAAAASDAGVYMCTVTNPCGSVSSATVSVTVTSAGIVSSLENELVQFAQVTPNPVESNSVITFGLKTEANVSIELSDVYGNVVANLGNSMFNAGNHTLSLNAAQFNIASGSYYLTINAGSSKMTKQVIFIR